MPPSQSRLSHTETMVSPYSKVLQLCCTQVHSLPLGRPRFGNYAVEDGTLEVLQAIALRPSPRKFPRILPSFLK